MKLSFLIREMEKIMSIRIKEINILKALIIVDGTSQASKTFELLVFTKLKSLSNSVSVGVGFSATE